VPPTVHNKIFNPIVPRVLHLLCKAPQLAVSARSEIGQQRGCAGADWPVLLAKADRLRYH
jgi:hypothetical protein